MLFLKQIILNMVFKIESWIPEEYSMKVEQDLFYIYFKGKVSKVIHFRLEKEVEEKNEVSQILDEKDKVEFQQLLFPIIKYADPISDDEALKIRQRIDFAVMEMEQLREINTMKMDAVKNKRDLDVTLRIA